MIAAPKPCSQCGTLVRDGSTRCSAHPRQVWAKHDTSAHRVTGRRLQRLRASLFTREPLCRICMLAGRTTLATIRDHIVPLFEGGADDDANTQPICAGCNRVKSAGESQRGRGLAAPAAASSLGGAGQKSPALGLETDRLGGILRAQVSGVGGVIGRPEPVPVGGPA